MDDAGVGIKNAAAACFAAPAETSGDSLELLRRQLLARGRGQLFHYLLVFGHGKIEAGFLEDLLSGREVGCGVKLVSQRLVGMNSFEKIFG